MRAQTGRSGRDVSGGQVLAPPRRRLLGCLIDGLILFLLTGALWIRLFVSFGNRMSNTLSAYPDHATAAAQAAIGRVYSTTLAPFLIELVTTVIVAAVYYWLLTANWGTTFGKRSVSCWVVSARTGTRPGLGASFVRAVVFCVGAPILPFFLADNLWQLGDRRQCLRDRAARTLVVAARPAAATSTGPGSADAADALASGAPVPEGCSRTGS